MKRFALLIVLIISVLATHAETITYAITGRNTLTATGTEPTGGSVELTMSSTTGQYTRITAGNSITLKLQNWAGVRITAITLSMASNTKAGAGTISVTHGNTTTYTKTGTFKDIAGAYTTAFVNVNLLPMPAFTVGSQEEVNITVTASENSLYVESYTITYTASSAPPPTPTTLYTVKFKTNTPDYVLSPLTESAEGAGVILPNVPYDKADNIWSFVGWTEQVCAEQTTAKPHTYAAGTIYYPTQNTTLYALYSDAKNDNDYVQLIDFQGADTYYIAGIWGQYMGVAKDFDKYNSEYVINATSCTILQNEEGLYYIDHHTMPSGTQKYVVSFLSSNTLTLSTTANPSRQIGYDANNKLCFAASVWNYIVLGDSSLYIYYNNYGTEYGLGYGTIGSAADRFGWRLSKKTTRPTKGIILLQSPAAGGIDTYTAYPEGAPYDGVEQCNALNINITNHKIYNPKGERLSVYTIMGILVCSSQEDIDMTDWHTGAYIIRSASGQSKMFYK